MLGLETVPNLLFGLSFFGAAAYPSFLLRAVVGPVGGLCLGTVLLRQGHRRALQPGKGRQQVSPLGSAVGVVPAIDGRGTTRRRLMGEERGPRP
ncbi:MAG TPA: hypothetical protein VGV91_18430 [Rubrobacter sp.]|nr:hypothetical protein [Rubrobacter sp.]